MKSLFKLLIFYVESIFLKNIVVASSRPTQHVDVEPNITIHQCLWSVPPGMLWCKMQRSIEPGPIRMSQLASQA